MAISQNEKGEMKMTREEMIVSKLSTLKTGKLIELWNETEKQVTTLELSKVRGWLMEALENKNPAAFDAWMEGKQGDDVAIYF